MNKARQNIRWQVNRKAGLSWQDNRNAFIDCIVGDISMNGAKIFLQSARLPAGDLELDIKLDDKVSLNGLKTGIAWRKEKETGNTYGLHFLNIKDDEKDKIFGFIYGGFSDDIKTPLWKKG